VRAVVRQSTFSVNEFFADSVSSKFVMIWNAGRLFICDWCFVDGVVIARIWGWSCRLLVHYYIQLIILIIVRRQ